MRFRFLLFLLMVLGLGVVVVVAGMPAAAGPRRAAALASIAALTVLSVWRYRRMAASVTADIGAACLIIAIGWAMPDHLVQVFGLTFVHLFVRAMDVSAPRVIANAALHPAAYFGAVALAEGAAGLARIDTLTKLAGFAFAAGLMHTLAVSFAEQEQTEQRMRFQALHDPLTGLPNRTLFTDRLERALVRGRRDGGRVALAFIDLDDFKDVNDSLGHAFGDRLLAALSERAFASLRGSDTAARLGGDEFALILEDVGDEHQALAAVNRALAVLREPFDVAGRPLSVSASVGIAVTSGADFDAHELLRQADIAMYAAKATGKGRCELYDAVMEAASHRQFQLPAPAGAGSASRPLAHDGSTT